jgi:hypothetical protein
MTTSPPATSPSHQLRQNTVISDAVMRPPARTETIATAALIAAPVATPDEHGADLLEPVHRGPRADQPPQDDRRHKQSRHVADGLGRTGPATAC